MSYKKSVLIKKQDIAIKGIIDVAPDKSISHRALIFAAFAYGKTKISNLLEGEDVLKTAQALRQMGVDISKNSDGSWSVIGVGYCGLNESNDVVDMGNSGTAARLLSGMVSSYDFVTFFTGDGSLRKRPMKRIFEPLSLIGASITSRQNNFMPFAIKGSKIPLAIDYKMNVASAQVKSAILLASLNIRGQTNIFEPEKCRDHTEIMMKYLGLKIEVSDLDNGKKISFNGMQEFDAKDFEICGDISSAAFLIVACLVVKDSKIVIRNIGVNPLRDGIIKTLQEMGGNILLKNQRLIGGELVADIEVEYSELKSVNVSAKRAPSMIDEYPILSIAAAHAKGVTRMNGLAELKVKESNRLFMIAENLSKCGVEVNMGDDYLEVKGGIKSNNEPINISTSMDHRIAMSFFVMGITRDCGVLIDDFSMVDTSFPNFLKIFSDLGYKIDDNINSNFLDKNQSS